MFEDDQDSLFGSPPPSPIRGRSPTLPAQTAQEKGKGIKQNVGTIALPGSHMSCSELPVEPSALPLGGFSIHESPRLHAPPLRPQQNNLQWNSAPPHRAPSSAPSSSRSSSTSCLSSIVTRKRKLTKLKSSTPRLEPPPITFPGPDDPVPCNFLRSQKALLGIAGLVGDIKPTSLPHQSLQGSTASNPIVIEELGSTPFTQSTHSLHTDSSQSALVDGEDVITSLIKEKNILPVLSSILKLLDNSPDPSPHPSTLRTLSFSRPYGARTLTGAPPLKRRKLTSVPAGAVDWDVPYPFPEGEGPKAYHATWERERVRQLMLQLLELIKGAMQGASARKRAQNAKMAMKKEVLKDRSTDRQGSASQESSVCIKNSRSSTMEPSMVESLGVDVEASTDSLDDLLASFFPSVPSHPHDLLEVPNMPLGETPQFDEALLDSWLAELQAMSPPDLGSDETTSVTPVPCLDDLIKSHSSSPAISISPIQSTEKSHSVVPRRVSYRPIDKENILQRTRERRRQIVAEIERAKVELWETSIEGGVLGHLMKDSTLA